MLHTVMMTADRLFFATVLVLLLPSCSVLPQPPKTPLRTYVVGLSTTANEPVTVAACGPATTTLLVNLPRAQTGVDSTRMAYLRQPYEMSYYADNQWADTPARLFAPLLVQALEQTGCWRTVVQLPAAVQGDYRLDTDIVQWQQEFFSSPSVARLMLRTQLVTQQGQEVLAAHRFDISEPAPSEDAQGGALAMNRAVTRVLGQLQTWVHGQMHQDRARREAKEQGVSQGAAPVATKARR